MEFDYVPEYGAHDPENDLDECQCSDEVLSVEEEIRREFKRVIDNLGDDEIGVLMENS